MEQNNPFINLMLANNSKNINHNFLETLSALIFFTKKEPSLINTPIPRIIHHKLKSEEEIDSEFKGLFKYQQVEQKELSLKIYQNMHVGDFLIYKLIENLRRLYSAHRNGGQLYLKYNIESESNIKGLYEQQKYIYKSLFTLKDYIVFNDELRLFKGTFFGENKACKSSELFLFLSFHEYIHPENQSLHLDLYNHFFLTHKNRNDFLYESLSKLSYSSPNEEHISRTMSFLDNDFFKLFAKNITNNTKFKFSSFSIDALTRISKDKIYIPNETKQVLFSKMTLNCDLFIKRPILSEQLYLIKSFFNDIPQEFIHRNALKAITQCQSNNSNAIMFFSSFIEKIYDNIMLIRILNNIYESKITTLLLSKYDFKDDNFISSFSRYALTLKDYPKIFEKLLFIAENNISNRSISNILSYDFNLIEKLNPIILKAKLSQEILTKESTNKNKIKI